MALRLTGRCFRFRYLCKQKQLKQLSLCSYSSNSQFDNGDHADIVISGGGMVGGAMACALGMLLLFSVTKKT